MRPEKLIEFRDIIRHCDFMANTSLEKSIVVRAAYYWRICRHFWTEGKLADDNNIIEDVKLSEEKYANPKNLAIIGGVRADKEKLTFDEMLTEEDKEFIKKLIS